MKHCARPSSLPRWRRSCCRSSCSPAGLTLTSATDVVIFAIACMALNILVGHTGLVSFGHGAWFGLGAYAAALAQSHWFPGSVLWPVLASLVILVVAAVLIGFLVLRRRGVYFSLLTLAFSALTFAVAFRWTSFTGGESGLGGVTRASWFGVDLESAWVYYALVARSGLGVVYALQRFHRSRDRTVLVAIRENEQRAQFIGYATNRYKQIAYTVSATLDRLRRCAVRVPSSLRVGRPDGGVVLGRAARDGDHRRHAQSARSGAGRAVLHPVPRVPVDLDSELAAVLRSAVRRRSSCFRRPDWSASGAG